MVELLVNEEVAKTSDIPLSVILGSGFQRFHQILHIVARTAIQFILCVSQV